MNPTTKRTLAAGLMLLVTTMTLSGCGKKQTFQCGDFSYMNERSMLMFGARSDIDTFHLDSVDIDLCIGLYDAEYVKKYSSDPKGFYMASDLADSEDAKAFFVLYICDPEDRGNFQKDQKEPYYEDYKSIEGLRFIKEIPEEIAFSDEYGFTIRFWKGIIYRHCETFRIPQEIFQEEKGTFEILLVPFCGSESLTYYTCQQAGVCFHYKKMDENTVKLEFARGV